MARSEDFIKAGIVLLMGSIILGTSVLTAEVAKMYSDLGVFMIIMAVVVATLSILTPLLKGLR